MIGTFQSHFHCRQLHSDDAEAVGGVSPNQENRLDLLQIGLTVKVLPPRSISSHFFTRQGNQLFLEFRDPEFLKVDLLDIDLGAWTFA